MKQARTHSARTKHTRTHTKHEAQNQLWAAFDCIFYLWRAMGDGRAKRFRTEEGGEEAGEGGLLPRWWFLGRGALRNEVAGEESAAAAAAWTTGRSTPAEVVRLEEVFDPRGMRAALLTSMVVDVAWVAHALLPEGLPTVLVSHWDPDQPAPNTPEIGRASCRERV